MVRERVSNMSRQKKKKKFNLFKNQKDSKDNKDKSNPFAQATNTKASLKLTSLSEIKGDFNSFVSKAR